MTTIGTSSLYSGTINGLNSLDLDTLNVSDIDGVFFSINTIECNDLQVDNELDLTANGVIKIGKNTETEITITDTQLGYLDAVSSNIQEQFNTLSTDLGSAETDIIALQTKTQNLEATSTTNTFSNSTTNFKDAIVDESITNVLSAFTYFDTNIALMRTASEYRKFWIGMTGDDTNATNRFAIGCNGVNEDQPEILMEIDATGEISMRNGLKIFDLSGDNVGTINNFSDSPKNSTFSIRTNGNLFLESGGINEDPELSRFIDAWSPTLKLGQLKGSTLQMRTDTDNLYKSRIILDKLTLFGGLGSGTNDASIELNGETQNHAYTDADHTAVEGIATIESDITTLQTDLDTAEANIVTLQTDLDTAEANIVTLQNEMEAVEIAVEVNFDQLQEKQYSYNPIGSVQIFAGNALPTGYLWCNGAQISQTTYADLYAVIGYIYSTDRKTSPSAGNFFLPDMRGLFVCGAGAPDSSSFVFNSNTYSKATGDFNEMSVQNHRHTTQTSSGTQSVNIGSATARNNDTQTRLSDVGVFYDDGTTPIVKNATEPFNICMNYIIKY